MRIYTKYAKTLPYKNKRKRRKDNGNTENNSATLPSKAQERSVFSTIDENFGFLSSIFGSGIGLVESKYDVLEGKAQVGVAYIEGLTDTKLISSQVIEPLLREKADFETGFFNNILMVMQAKLIALPNIKQSSQMKEVVDGLLNGNTMLFTNGLDTALIIGSRKVEKRSIEKPENEVTVLGALDSFTEDLETNGSLIIRRLPTPDLHFETFTVGKYSQTKVKLLWLEGIANKQTVEEAGRRLQGIDIDALPGGIGSLAELIQENPLSVFPKYRQTQRPDTVAKNLTDGRFAIICSNSPFALIAPVSFWDNFKTIDDYSETPVVASFLRFARIMSFFLLSIIGPLYLSFVAYNHTIVPPALALNIATGRQGVPFPSVVELLMLTVSIDIIREASLRISGSVGVFIGVLSATVLGQASVAAGYVSASVIIVVAASAISSFAVSSTTLVYPSRLITYFFILLASVFGMFGLLNGIVLVTWHLVSLESFGVPYFYPLVPFNLEGMKDTFVRLPFSALNKRLRLLAPSNRIRMNDKGE